MATRRAWRDSPDSTRDNSATPSAPVCKLTPPNVYTELPWHLLIMRHIERAPGSYAATMRIEDRDGHPRLSPGPTHPRVADRGHPGSLPDPDGSCPGTLRPGPAWDWSSGIAGHRTVPEMHLDPVVPRSWPSVEWGGCECARRSPTSSTPARPSARGSSRVRSGWWGRSMTSRPAASSGSSQGPAPALAARSGR